MGAEFVSGVSVGEGPTRIMLINRWTLGAAQSALPVTQT